MIFLDSQESSGSQTDPAANVTVVSTGASSHGLTSSIEIETPAEFVNPKGIRFTHDIDGVTGKFLSFQFSVVVKKKKNFNGLKS